MCTELSAGLPLTFEVGRGTQSIDGIISKGARKKFRDIKEALLASSLWLYCNTGQKQLGEKRLLFDLRSRSIAD